MTFVVSQGQLARVQQRHVREIQPSSVRLSDQTALEYAEIWRVQPQVRTVVGFLARNIAQLGLHVFRRVSDLDRERITNHPLAQLLSRPSPWMTPYRFVESVVSDIGIYDNAIIAKIRLPDRSWALQRIDPRRVTPEGENPFFVEKYRIRGTTRDNGVTLGPDQVIHLRGYSPLNERWGTSPMETLRTILAEEYQAQLHREQLWRNGARVSGYLLRPAGVPWSSEAKERFRAQWRAQYTGDGAQVGGTPILEDGMTYVPASMSPKDAQYIESRKLTREEVTAAYHVPPTLVGIMEASNYSNMREQHKILYQDTLGPWLTMIQQELALQLIPDFPDNEDLYVEFNLAEKLRGSFEEQASQLQTAVGAPYMTRNEARAKLNLPQIDHGDDLVTPLNVLIGGQASPTDSAPPAEGEIEAPTATAAQAAQLRAVGD